MEAQCGSEELKREFVQKVLASHHFARANRLSALLTFICDKSLQGCAAADLIENQIGTQVFGRPPGYNPMEDNIVRSTVRLLRQRLTEYYETDGQSDALRIVIPKGRYVAEFLPKEDSITAVATPEPEAISNNMPAANPQKVPRRGFLGWPALATASVAGLAIFGGKPLATADPLARFWSQLLSPRRRGILVASDTALVLAQDLSGQDMSVEEYFSGQWKERLLGQTPNRWFEKSLVTRRYSGIVDTDFALKICRRKEAQGVDVSLRMCRELRVPDSQGANLVVTGAAHANPWVKLLDRDANFHIQHLQSEHRFLILNRKPQANEPRQWQSKDPERVYGVISFLPRPEGEGNALLLQGASIAGTECAINYVTQPELFALLWTRLAPKENTVPHFEAVLQTSSLGGNAAVSEIVGYRVHPA